MAFVHTRLIITCTIVCLQLFRAIAAETQNPPQTAEVLQGSLYPDHFLQEPIHFSDNDSLPEPRSRKYLYLENFLEAPIDYFHNDSRYEPHSHEKFNLRYFFDDQYYREGGPIIVLSGAEASAAGSLPLLQRGIIKVLAQATGGLGVVLEHRYYGESFPVPDLSTENFRFHTTDQAMGDMAYFSQHVTFPGHEGKDMTATRVPYIWYGGSYAGALVGLYRKLYPHLAWGAIASSSVPFPVSDYWEYYEVTRKYGPADCIDIQTKLVNVIDNILTGDDPETESLLKEVFGLQGVTDNANFATVVTGGRGQWQSFVSLTAGGIGLWQSRSWSPEYNRSGFENYCRNITSDEIIYPKTARLTSDIENIIQKGGWADELGSLVNKMLNLVGWVNETAVSRCSDTQEQCFSQWTNSSATFYTDRSLSNQALSWPYQYCTQWGCLPSGSLPSNSDEADARLPLVSRLISSDYNRLICKHAFDISGPPDVESIHKHGGHNLSYPRLAFVDGEADNWRPLSPQAVFADGQPTHLNTRSTISEPKIIVKDAVHGWEMYGVFENDTTPDVPPQPIKDTQAELSRIVMAWMAEWAELNSN